MVRKHLSPSLFIKVYTALENTITKGKGSLLFWSAKRHGACLSIITKASICICVCVFSVRLPRWLARSDGPSRSMKRTTWHQSVRKALALASAFLIDRCHKDYTIDKNCPSRSKRAMKDRCRRSAGRGTRNWLFRMII